MRNEEITVGSILAGSAALDQKKKEVVQIATLLASAIVGLRRSKTEQINYRSQGAENFWEITGTCYSADNSRNQVSVKLYHNGEVVYQIYTTLQRGSERKVDLAREEIRYARKSLDTLLRMLVIKYGEGFEEELRPIVEAAQSA